MKHPKACRNEKLLQTPRLLLNMQTETLQANAAHGESHEEQTREPVNEALRRGPEKTVALSYNTHTHTHANSFTVLKGEVRLFVCFMKPLTEPFLGYISVFSFVF